MVIVRSQDKKQLINSNRIKIEQFVPGKASVVNISSYLEMSIGFDLLGEYSSFERALEVLDTIQSHIKNVEDERNYKWRSQQNWQLSYDELSPVFIMPEE